MAADRIAVTLRATDALNAALAGADVDRFVERHLSPDVEFRPATAAVDSRTYRGRAEVADYLRSLIEIYSEQSVEITSAFETADGRVVAFESGRIVARQSGVPMDYTLVAIFTIDDKRVASIWGEWSLEDALARLGIDALPEPTWTAKDGRGWRARRLARLRRGG